jgi:hypothetical protein
LRLSSMVFKTNRNFSCCISKRFHTANVKQVSHLIHFPCLSSCPKVYNSHLNLLTLSSKTGKFATFPLYCRDDCERNGCGILEGF